MRFSSRPHLPPTLRLRSAAARWALALRTLLTAIVVFGVLSGCATEDIIVSEAAMTSRPDASILGWTASESGQVVFSPEDEQATIKVLFNFNYRGVYEWYRVEWIAPGGTTYQVVSRRTDFGSHREFQASLKIRGKMASRLPGLWRVHVSLRGREGAADRPLVSRLFRIAKPSAALLAAGLTPVDVPDSDQPRPLASYEPMSTHSPTKAGVDPANASPPSTGISAAEAAPVSASPQPEPSTPAPTRTATKVPASALGVLPPLAIVGTAVETTTAAAPPSVVPAPAQTASSPVRTVSPTKTPVTKPVLPIPGESVATVVTLPSAPRAAEKRSLSSRTRNYAGCPPLYYRPGPGCVEQSPEE